MRQNIVFQLTFLILMVKAFFSCSNNSHFTVRGSIKNGNTKTLYFENVSASKVIPLDSVKLGKDGSYIFKYAKPVAPDFFRLRLNNTFINFSADSTETIVINSDTINFAKGYTVEGSTESEFIKSLTLLQLKTNETYGQLKKQYSSGSMTADEYKEQVVALVEGYKNEAKNYIYSNPATPSAYFALFQQVDGLLLFDPYDNDDTKVYGAVANSWNQRYPEAPRTKHLVRLYTTALAIMRGERLRSSDINTVDNKDYFDISLLSFDNRTFRLSEAGKNKVVLVDFIAYEMKESPAHNRQLLNVYEKYYNRGFQIYQISLDTDEHFWKNAAYNLPWICVRDPQSVNSDIARKYNVRELPASFIFNREGEIVKRIEDYSGLEADIFLHLK